MKPWTANEGSRDAASAEAYTVAIYRDALIAAQAGSARYSDTEWLTWQKRRTALTK